jgi:ABC-type glycerol-3-phosphate transport system substrate-binding protein
VSPFGILALLSLRRRKQFSRRTLAARIAFLTAILLAIPACGGSTSLQPPLGTSTVTMTASAVGGSAHHSASITITITQ